MKIATQRKTVTYLRKIGFSKSEAIQLMRAIDYNMRVQTFKDVLNIIEGKTFRIEKKLVNA